MDKPRISVDFNELAGNIVLLSKGDTKMDSEGSLVTFHEGMTVSVYDNNEENGKPDNLIADGIAILNPLVKEHPVNYGKTGTIGQYQIKEFGSEEECQKEAKKLIASKVKKGYKPYPEFDPVTQFYFDDDEIGLHPLTSHPVFRAHCTAEFYYDCVDEEAPFGSDEGADTLAFITEIAEKMISDLERFKAT